MAVTALRGSDPPRGDLAVSLRLTHLLMVEAVVSGEGLARVTEIASAAMGDAAVVVCVPHHDIAEGSPRLVTGPLLATLLEYAARGARAAARPSEVTLEEPIVSGGEVIGVVGIVGAVAAEIRDDAHHFLHLVAMAALIDIAIEEVGSENEGNACGAFFEDLRSNRALGREEVVQRAGRLGCDLTAGVVVLCADLATRRPRHVVALITGDHPGALVDLVDGRLFAILPAPHGPSSPEEAVAAACRLSATLERHGRLALSGFYPDPVDVARAVLEAELVLDLAGDPVAAAGASGGEVRRRDRRRGSHPEAVWSVYEETVAALVLHDQRYGSHLLRTLVTHLRLNADVDATAASARAKRHTIVHRLERVHELTGLDCERPDDRVRLSLGIRAHRLLGPELPR